ncbi:MAG: aminoglycoside phosphotransferase family protein [Chloroflexota bacterium]|nr:aminoglycoside phosphotransferase family protein [Anaerolineales bacterium]MCA9978483.1 aminoglycoside phosphotransferase family protein [Anaerolineales bacterium]MCB8965906.1 aminoglycoside phosphotransferase family protein [Ardenticatenaceae bacterium]
MPTMLELLPQVKLYVRRVDLSCVPGFNWMRETAVSPLAQGEYNMNYLLQQDQRKWVLRVNVGTQINRDDQILYEYQALQLLAQSAVTPRPYFVDDSRMIIPYGVLIMEYLPGEALDYGRDLETAAKLFARVHSVHVNGNNHLIQEKRPLSMTYEECSGLLPVYLESELADPAVRDYLQEVLAWADEARHTESYFLNDPWLCVINTEVNSGNFIANRAAGSLHLVDWEKPLWGDPSQDLSHFCVPTTTLWKTDYRLATAARQQFLHAYKTAVSDPHLRDTIEERVRLRDPFNCLRGISWSAMAWVTYQTNEHGLQNNDTFQKICSYLQMDFVRSLFADYVQ